MALLEMKGITKYFYGTAANDHVDLTVGESEIHALLGENGAGKTTLMNILYGLYRSDEGEIWWKGEQRFFQKPQDAIACGIGMVHQHFMLVRPMTVLQNIILGMKLEGFPLIKEKKVTGQIEALCEKYGLAVDVHKRIEELSVGEQQRVEILKALYRNAKLLVLDEPTAVLTPQETDVLFSILKSLKADGHSIILISHRLAEIMQITDRITVLRSGRKIDTLNTAQCTEAQLSQLMIGRQIRTDKIEYEKKPQPEHVLKVTDLTLANPHSSKPYLDHISFCLHAGEILGIAGVDGNGQNYLAEFLCGIRRQNSRSVLFKQKYVDKLNVRQHFELGIAYIPDDRHRDGLILDKSVKENLILRDYRTPKISKFGVIDEKRAEKFVQDAISGFGIRVHGSGERAGNLSGGNQQKIILAREIGDDPELLIAMQPTRGLDIGASGYVRTCMQELRDRGKGVLLISTDLDEIMQVADRIAVMYEGKIMGIIENTPELKAETLGLMMGGRSAGEVAAG